MLKKYFFSIIIILLTAFVINAQVPQLINYQAILTDMDGNPIDGSRSIQFKIYDSEVNGDAQWSETHVVTVSNGFFSVLLGSTTPIPYPVFDGTDKYLSIQVENDPEMTPRKRLVSVGYSMRSYDADKVDGQDASALVQQGEANSISTIMIQDNAVTTVKISPDIISSISSVSNDGGNIDLIAGSNVTITPDDANNRITISASPGVGGDDLGNHTATQNINLNGNWLSGDGGYKGVYVNANGNVGIGTADPTAQLYVSGIDGVVFEGNIRSGIIPKEGQGTRLMWYPRKAAFRAGYINGNQWDADSIGNYSTAMGQNSLASGEYSTSMGEETKASGYAAVAMGSQTTASGNYSTALGIGSEASGFNSTALGDETEASGEISLSSGIWSIASGALSIAMGARATARGDYSFAAGTFAKANHDGCFVWSDGSGIPSPSDSITSTGPNQFIVRASGGVYFYSNNAATAGVQLNPGASSWSTISDSTKKENFRSVDGELILKKISDFNLGTWNYRGQDPAKFRHYGPMAQDFFTAFGRDGIGTIGNDTTLSSADFDGINFIAIQALEKRTTELRKQISDLQKENQLLNTELNQMKNRIMDLGASLMKLQTQLTKADEAETENKFVKITK